MPVELVSSSRFARFMQLVNPNYHLPSLGNVTDMLSNSHAHHMVQISEKLRSVDTVYLSQELCVVNGSETHLATFSAHYIENWTFKHLMISSGQADPSAMNDESGWLQFRNARLPNIFKNIKILATVNNLTDVFHLPGCGVSSVSKKPILHVGRKGFVRLLDEAVVSSLSKSGEKTIAIISKAIKLLNVPGVVWEFDHHNPDKVPWFSQLTMLDKVLRMDADMKEQISASSDDAAVALLDNEDIALLSKVIEILRPFQEVAERVRNRNAVTCSLAFASIKLLKAALKDFSEAYPNFELISELSREFQTATSLIDSGEINVYTTATVLDPRFKLQWCDSESQSYFKKGFVETAKTAQAPRSHQSVIEIVKTEPFQSGGFFTRILKQQPESLQSGTITSEVLRYLDEPLMQEDCDILSYWQANETNFPHLALMAQQYLAMPTSSANVDHFFNLQGQISDIGNTVLSGDVLQKFVELRSSFRH